jgi:hypothetical protein
MGTRSMATRNQWANDQASGQIRIKGKGFEPVVRNCAHYPEKGRLY